MLHTLLLQCYIPPCAKLDTPLLLSCIPPITMLHTPAWLQLKHHQQHVAFYPELHPFTNQVVTETKQNCMLKQENTSALIEVEFLLVVVASINTTIFFFIHVLSCIFLAVLLFHVGGKLYFLYNKLFSHTFHQARSQIVNYCFTLALSCIPQG